MKLIADSGSTKTDWLITESGEHLAKVQTQGINPFHQSEEEIEAILQDELIPKLAHLLPTPSFELIEFYGAGCTKEKCPVVEGILRRTFTRCKKVVVDSDLLGAAKALCGDKEGIACILGTGANSCLYEGNTIVNNVSPMGYILGDEGSGAVIGKTFITELYKGFHKDFILVFEQETGLSQSDIIQKVYREPLANRFLASLTVFIAKHKDDQKWLKDLLTECFRLFFKRNIKHYERYDLPVNFVGSIAFYFKEELTEAATLEGFTVGTIKRSPL